MFKLLSITGALTLASVSTATLAAPSRSVSFVHDGETYKYSIEKKANTRVIRGSTKKSGKPFVLYVTGNKVSGTVDGRYVSFPLSEVKSLAGDTQLASR